MNTSGGGEERESSSDHLKKTTYDIRFILSAPHHLNKTELLISFHNNEHVFKIQNHGYQILFFDRSSLDSN